MKLRSWLVVLVVLLSGCSAGDGNPSDLQQYYEQKPDWKACDDYFRCADIKVPLDYDQLDAGSITLALAMHTADQPDQKLGALVLNPGGPGGSGIEYLEAYESQLGRALSDRFDLVSWDPRGVGRSDQIKCEDGSKLDAFLAIDPTPDDAAEQSALSQSFNDLAKSCEENSGKLFAHVSTEETVRDLDIIRAVLGEEKLNFLGKSGGTQIGAVYASIWPDRVGKFVLDGGVDMSISAAQLALGQAIGFDTALRRFSMFCADPANNCKLGADTDAIITFLRDFTIGLDAKPLKTNDPNRMLTEGLAWSAILGAMYSPVDGWSWLADSLAQAKKGDGTGLLDISDWYNGRNPDGSYLDNSTQVFFATTCLDYPDEKLSPSVIEPQFVAMAPLVGRVLAWGEVACQSWPVKGKVLTHDVSAAKAASPILVIGTSYDPATPNAWSRKLAEQLGSGVYLNFDGDGHTGYFSGSKKLDKAVEDYFISGVVPAANSVYLPDQPLL